MHRSEDSWICIADLFAGLMAFFVFVSVGLLSRSDDYADDTTGSFSYNDKVISDTNGTIALESGMAISTSLFKNNSSEFSDEGIERLGPIKETLTETIGLNPEKKKILFTGHSSCRCETITDDPQTNYIAQYMHNMKLSLERAAAICAYMKNEGILDSFADADIRYRGLSEDMAAKAQPNGICEDRTLSTDKEKRFRIVAIELYKEWPFLPLPNYMNKDRIKEKSEMQAVSGPEQSPPAAPSEI